MLGNENYAHARARFMSAPRWVEGLTTFRERVLPLIEQAGLREPYYRPPR